MSERSDFLVEIRTEELPPKALKTLMLSFADSIKAQLATAKLSYDRVESFATPRRLALCVFGLMRVQATQRVERKGPAVGAAFDAEGKPTPAARGFAKSCGKDLADIGRIKTDKGEWLFCQLEHPGLAVEVLLPDMVDEALKTLPIAKRMRWGNKTRSFVRPVHGVVMMLDKQVIEARYFDITSSAQTRGHRFLANGLINIKQPSSYVQQLKDEGFVIASVDQRRAMIKQQIERCIGEKFSADYYAKVDEALLDEVTALVEWPVVLIPGFDAAFLSVPKEALISAMQDHQKCFPIFNRKGALQPYFVAVSNLQSENEREVIEGNACVMRARLSDAAFFYAQDKKQTLSARVDDLAAVLYQKELGSLLDKVKRVEALACRIANAIKADEAVTARAAHLCKADLTTQMVGEFPALQGVMGRYYALHEGEPEAVAHAIEAHYLPRFASDVLPESLEATAVALADRLDTLLGIFSVSSAPSGDKDPFALRRAAIAVLRLLVEKALPLDIEQLIAWAGDGFTQDQIKQDTCKALALFFYDRMRHYALSQNISVDVFLAVKARGLCVPYTAMACMQAVSRFKQQAQAQALAAANKRVSNLLNKQQNSHEYDHAIDQSLLEHDSEKALYQAIVLQQKKVMPLLKAGDYQGVLDSLATMSAKVDAFFEDVMVMVDQMPVRDNRLCLLKQLRDLFLQVADIALLQYCEEEALSHES